MKCCVLSCKNYSDRRDGDAVTFHLFPCDEVLRKQWIEKINRPNWSPSKFAKVCSAHFDKCDFRVTKNNLRILYKGALPCIGLDSPVPPKLPEPIQSLPNRLPTFEEIQQYKVVKYENSQLKLKARRDKLHIKRLTMKTSRLRNKINQLENVIKDIIKIKPPVAKESAIEVKLEEI